ncbi:MAG: ATP-binding protein [Planctomycetota bacterium]
MSASPYPRLLRKRLARLRSVAARKARTLEKARSLLQTIVDHTPAALLLVDDQGRIVEANRLAAEVHGTDPVGRACHEVLLERRTRCEGCELCLDLPAALPCAGRIEHTDSRTGEVLASEVVPVRFADGKVYALIVERIVTEQRKLEARMIHQEKMAAFGLLAAGIAHDLGNPLSAVEMNVRLLDDAALPDDERLRVGEIRAEVERLRRTLRELVDFARRRRDERAEVSVQAVVEDALRLCRHDPRMRRIEVTTAFDPETPAVRIVEDHLVQVVLNLLLNALDAMPEGGLDIRLGRRTARSSSRSATPAPAWTRTAWPAASSRCSRPRSRAAGTGLGLSVCKDIVEAAGGEIAIASEPGRGTRILLAFPVAAEEAHG